MAKKWSKEELALATIFTSAAIADWGQTRNITKRYDEDYHEKNPLLGKNPSTNKVDTYMPLAILGTLGLAYALPKKYRKTLLTGASILELGIVGHNKKIGLKIDF